MNNAFLLILCCCSLLFVQCNRNVQHFTQEHPEKTALTFAYNLSKFNFDQIEHLVDPDTRHLLTHYRAALTTLSDEKRVALMQTAEARAEELKKADCKVSGEKALCTICCTKENTLVANKVALKQINNKWFVDLQTLKNSN